MGSDLGAGAGGRTEFLIDGREHDDPARTVKVHPGRGDLLLWATCDRKGRIDTRTYRRGEFLRHVEKWILNRFFEHPTDIRLKQCRRGLKPLAETRGRYFL